MNRLRRCSNAETLPFPGPRSNPQGPTSASRRAYSEVFKVTLIGQRLRFGRSQKAAPFASAVWRKP